MISARCLLSIPCCLSSVDSGCCSEMLQRRFWELFSRAHAKCSSSEPRGPSRRAQPSGRAGWEGHLLTVSFNASFLCFIPLSLVISGLGFRWQMAPSTGCHPAANAAARLRNPWSVLVIAPRNCVYIISRRHPELKNGQNSLVLLAYCLNI